MPTSIIEAVPTDVASAHRLMRVKELWTRSRQDQLEIGRLLYEEREERCAVGGRGVEGGFISWCREAGIPKASAYRRLAEYEISIGVRQEKEEKPVSPETTFKPTESRAIPEPETPVTVEPVAPEAPKPEQSEQPTRGVVDLTEGMRVRFDGIVFKISRKREGLPVFILEHDSEESLDLMIERRRSKKVSSQEPDPLKQLYPNSLTSAITQNPSPKGLPDRSDSIRRAGVQGQVYSITSEAVSKTVQTA